METEQLIRNGIQEFEKRWGLKPNGVLINPKQYIRSSMPCHRTLSLDGVPIFRSPDIEENKIRFVL